MHQPHRALLGQLPTKIVIIVLAAVIIVCSGGIVIVRLSHPSGTSTRGIAPTPTNTRGASSPAASTGAPPLVMHGGVFEIGGLHIDTPEGIVCPYGKASGYGSPSEWLVLTTDPLKVAPSQVQAMKNYAQALYTAWENRSQEPPVPPELVWTSGAPAEHLGPFVFNGCYADLQLTNTGATPVQISKVGVRVTAVPQPNHYQYRLINLCSLLPSGSGCLFPYGGVPNECEVYQATVQITGKTPGTSFANKLVGVLESPSDPPCPEFTLAPGQTLEAQINYTLTNLPSNFIYSVMPQLTFDLPTGPQTIELKQLGTTLVFAEQSQFSCYTLQGDAFMPMAFQIQNSEPETWCL
jgi:hypothetical protein